MTICSLEVLLSPFGTCLLFHVPNVRTLRQDKESVGVLRGFIGQSLPGRAPRREQGESGSLQDSEEHRAGGDQVFWGNREGRGLRTWRFFGSGVWLWAGGPFRSHGEHNLGQGAGCAKGRARAWCPESLYVGDLGPFSHSPTVII